MKKLNSFQIKDRNIVDLSNKIYGCDVNNKSNRDKIFFIANYEKIQKRKTNSKGLDLSDSYDLVYLDFIKDCNATIEGEMDYDSLYSKWSLKVEIKSTSDFKIGDELPPILRFSTGDGVVICIESNRKALCGHYNRVIGIDINSVNLNDNCNVMINQVLFVLNLQKEKFTSEEIDICNKWLEMTRDYYNI